MKWATWDDGAGGAMRAENPRVDLIYRVPQIDVGNKHRHLQYSIPVTSSSLEDRMNVVKCLFGLLLDWTELFLASLWINRQLSGDEHKTVVNGGLRVVPGWLRSVRSIYSFDFHDL